MHWQHCSLSLLSLSLPLSSSLGPLPWGSGFKIVSLLVYVLLKYYYLVLFLFFSFFLLFYMLSLDTRGQVQLGIRLSH